MIYFTAHTLKCVCHCRRAMFRVLGMYNFAKNRKKILLYFCPSSLKWVKSKVIFIQFLVEMETSKFAFEIYRPLVIFRRFK